MFVAICDDDSKARERYAAALTRICAENDIALTLATYETGAQLLFALDDRAAPPDIILLDIAMPKIDGMQTALELRRKNYAGAIIFLTHKDDRMLDAFDVGAFNYVVKGMPREAERLKLAFLTAAERTANRKRRFLLCNSISEHRNIPLDAIRYFSMNRHVCTVHYAPSETFDFSTTAARLENMLAASGFARVHRSFVVNCARVKSYTFRECVLDDGTSLPVGRKYAQTLRAAMKAQAWVDMEDDGFAGEEPAARGSEDGLSEG